MNEKLTSRIRWGVHKDNSYFGMFCVHPADEKEMNQARVFHFFEKHDADEFVKLLNKSCHRRLSEAK